MSTVIVNHTLLVVLVAWDQLPLASCLLGRSVNLWCVGIELMNGLRRDWLLCSSAIAFSFRVNTWCPLADPSFVEPPNWALHSGQESAIPV